jgi:hypothetical protein
VAAGIAQIAAEENHGFVQQSAGAFPVGAFLSKRPANSVLIPTLTSEKPH